MFASNGFFNLMVFNWDFITMSINLITVNGLSCKPFKHKLTTNINDGYTFKN